MDLLQFSKDFFVEKAQQVRMSSYKLPASTSRPFGELPKNVQQQVEDVFKRYDLNCDLSISIDELRELMADLGGLFGFSQEIDASTLMALLDADGNNEISWQVPARQAPHNTSGPPCALCPRAVSLTCGASSRDACAGVVPRVRRVAGGPLGRLMRWATDTCAPCVWTLEWRRVYTQQCRAVM